MNKINWRQKLSSRKLWAAAAGVAAGLAVAFGLDEGTISAMAGAVELIGAVGALYVSLPLLGTLLDMLGDLT